MVGPRAVPGAQETEFDRVFDLGGTPDRYINRVETTEATASTQASEVMRAHVWARKLVRLRDSRYHVPVAGMLLILSVSSQHSQKTSFGIGD